MIFMKGVYVILFILPIVWSWHNVGHSVILQIALNQLDDVQQNIIKKHLTSLEQDHFNLLDIYSASCWADVAKKTDFYKETWKWHVVNKKYNGDILDINAESDRYDFEDQENVISKVKALIEAINLKEYSDKTSMNVRFLVHITADLHHPLHVLSNYNFGSLITILYNNSKENFHFFTDRVAGALLDPYELPLSESMIEYVKEQATLISHRCSLLTSDLFIAVEEWAEESFKKGVYLLELLKRQNGNKEVIEIVDVREMQELLLDQICIAGKRLGFILSHLQTHKTMNLFSIGLLFFTSVLSVLCLTCAKQNKKMDEGRIPLLKKK